VLKTSRLTAASCAAPQLDAVVRPDIWRTLTGVGSAGIADRGVAPTHWTLTLSAAAAADGTRSAVGTMLGAQRADIWIMELKEKCC
jgi:hypothetical protein